MPAALALARGGAGQIGLVDPDPVELSNLARQIIYRGQDIGSPKVDAAARHLGRKFGGLEIEAHHCELDSRNAAHLIGAYGFVIDATDNPAAKFLINDACVASRRPFVYGGVLGLTGQAMTVLPAQTACLRCLFEEPPDQSEIASCRAAGIVGPVAGAIGEVQAHEALRWLRGAAPALILSGRILTYDAAEPRVRVMPIEPRRGCACGAARRADGVVEA